ncbi:hypothetical protein BO86DRAFT_73044 [Aspergillus japonicus CBS 114.51]|uniref:Zn(2)-C6 fungal-type domain-containing protein n=1 Tax=Aspergillus japonicus CBS 114.51 TaxID=1448312 RepID=A0A8T8XER0_ASPJA|nr:hypothetical protein BO86DRAFT_73044 [Aspergillus japonicus CBS 114.51]RAH86776.1 hypothetical protein BO86DRAFT_73044 [Aspergillus japonicus CBS 114.51]
MSAPTASSRATPRSRKGCPECRKRRIKCDEQKPQCGHCVRVGRVCHLVDSLFITHPYSSSSTHRRPPKRPRRRGTDGVSGRASVEGPPVVTGIETDPHSRSGALAESDPRDPSPISSAPVTGGPSATQLEPSHLLFEERPSPQNCAGDAYSTATQPTNALGTPGSLASDLPGDTHRDQQEIAFLLRYFSEGPAKFLDVCCDLRPYFSRYVVAISRQSALVRYSACALAAKQLGHMKDPEARIQRTRCQTRMLKVFAESNLDFLWYGAKYYERAIQLLARQLSHGHAATYRLSPSSLYQTHNSNHSNANNHGIDVGPLQILASCILSQYEDLSASMRAWSGHLNGVCKLLHPHLVDPIVFLSELSVPEPALALDTIFWFFALNDVLDAFVGDKPPRLDFGDHGLWRRMGLPLDDAGQLSFHQGGKQVTECIFLKSLIWLLSQVITIDMTNSTQWVRVSEQLDQWHSSLPVTFSSPVAWQSTPEANESEQEYSAESWYASDTCAIAMAFYHMARIVLLIHQPQDVFLQQSRNHTDLLRSYTGLQQGLRRHAMEIVPISRGMPSDVVQKYLIQPLYMAGRCLGEPKERQEVLAILLSIDDNLGVFTCYRVQALSEEWRIPYTPPIRNTDER